MDLATQLQTALRTQSIPVPSLTWLTTLATARTPPPPLASLIATARARLLASDLTSLGLLDEGYRASHSLPPITSATSIQTPKETRLPVDVVVQIVDLENITRSRWEQVEELEAIERGEQTRGREVIRLPLTLSDEEDGGGGCGGGCGGGLGDDAATQRLPGSTAAATATAAQPKNATHKLVLQDSRGQRVYALELKRVERIAVGKTNIGEKILLKSGTKVARGVVMLEPSQCVVLGGKVEAWHKAWVEGRLERLREAVGSEKRQ
ncbi:hypothetical protein B0H63DRAFT_175516 [Podospora didyma]|uniref:RecQ-mediated genome instability protein 1 n=1 Tax=Podospora didyma TaxID=330526 RepID=A0AAE0TZA7_9PEZI|nr:hypothetical protein B0H63DRAFT_175516 [Podospora didyma]